MRDTILFCDGWEFSLQPIGTEYRDDFEWRAVDIPHDWLIEDTNDLYKTSTGWYRRRFTVPNDGRRTSLRFEGVYMDSRVYVNGKPAGEWKYGYTTFEFDITEYLHEGENEVTVRVDHREPNSRWYSGAGIYRRVWLNRFEDTHILPDGVYISADTEGKVTVTAETERPSSESVSELTIKSRIFSDSGELLSQTESAVCAYDRSAMPETVLRDGCSYSSNTQFIKLASPKLWDIESPVLYNCEVSLYRGGELIDKVSSKFGFRSIEFTTDHGFFLNGRHVKLHGACMHHDLGALGSAVNRSAIRRQLSILQQMGVNAVRTSHNPPAVELLELADEMGMLILDEGFDMWERSKTEFDYARFFPEWISRDVSSWIRRDRNHPCIIGWSIGNEIYDTHADERGQEVTSLLRRLVQSHDPRGNGYITIGSNYMGSDNARRCADILKAAGYNYAERLYDEQHSEHPDWMMYGSETSSVVQSRGIYHFPLSKPILCEDDEQCSALGNSSPAWAAKSWEACIIPDRDREYCAGQFIWTGFDYIGEPTPYSTKNSYFGQIDTAGFPKDSFYVFRSVWTDYRSSPFVHIFPYWDFSEGDLIDIRTASNCPHVDLLFNGEVIAHKDFKPQTDTELTLDIKLAYKKGTLSARAYDEDGRLIAEDTVKSFGDSETIELSADTEEIKAGSTELCFVTISTADSEGNPVRNARDRVFVSVEGAGRLVGLDNGDSTDYEQYKAASRRLFSGKLLAIIGATGESGDIKVRVTSPSAKGAELIIRAVPSEAVSGISLNAHNTERKGCTDDLANDIPVRRIELSGERLVFGPGHSELSFETRVYPADSVYSDEIEYRITTPDGIDSPLAQIVSAENGRVTVKCKGDGEFCLRAAVRNGTERISLYTMLSLRGEGLGSAMIDPYKLVAGGLFTLAQGEVSGGIQHGAAFGRDGGWFGFENVDLGSVGSDEITIPLFANYSTPVHISVWDGTPEDGDCLGRFEYALPPVWLTYQAMKYKLPKVLRGVHTISFSSDLAYDVQGFVFEKHEKESSELFAGSAEEIYGDSFTRSGDEVTGIGNNVILGFGEFDFTDKAPVSITVTGRSGLPVNSIHLQFDNGEQKRILLEFKGCEDYTAQTFPIEGFFGKGRLSFVFLPGCNFDMKSFSFELEQ